jgi:hypothetical protein
MPFIIADAQVPLPQQPVRGVLRAVAERPYPRFVSKDELREAVEVAMASGAPSSGDNLLGMEMDFVARLSGLDELDSKSVKVRRTGSTEELIIATCRCAEGVPLAVAGNAVRTVWLDDLRYSEFEAHSLAISDGVAELRFVTQMSRGGGLYVTGVVEVRG